VWDAWNDPKQAAKWWGPRGFTITHFSKDLRPGGTWVYTMHGPDGVDYPNITFYHEVEMYSRLVYDHGASETTPPLFRVTVNFSEKNKKTTIDMTMAFESPEKAKEIGKFIKQAGGNATWDRLAEYLEHETSGREEFVINRSFAAPIATVFDMFSKPEHLGKWLPPTGFTMEYLNKPEIKPGSENFYKMSNGDMTMYGKIKYLEINPVHLLSYVQSFSDEKGNMGRHPMLKVWPDYMHTTVRLTDEGQGETRVTIVWTPQNAKPEEIQAFVDLKPGMTMGWTGSFDKMEELLK
jgi:uncharacterized protein YndB with AHSA1/START domain